MLSNANSQFAFNPSVNVPRSSFKIPHKYMTTLNCGSLIPCYWTEILPGDTVSMDVASLIRMSTPIFPVADNCYLDQFWFFVPNRLLWSHWREFMGEQQDPDWTPSIEYEVPHIWSGAKGNLDNSKSVWTKGTIADYLGFPTNVANIHGNALPFRAYVKIWNEWFRDQNVMRSAFMPDGDEDVYAEVQLDDDDNYDYINSACMGLKPLPVSRYHDLFSSCLPQPQKGNPVEIGLLQSNLPVGTLGTPHNDSALNVAPLQFDLSKINIPTSGAAELAASSNGVVQAMSNAGSTSSSGDLYLTNLYADVSQAIVASVNELRQAFAIQTLLERDARGGTRYRELLYTHFGVDNGDARMQVPEYLYGKRIPINIDSIYSTVNADEVKGSPGGFSLTTDVNNAFTKSFTEHGILMCVCCVRTQHSYQQGIDKQWSRRKRFDYYFPTLANLSEQPVLSQSLCATNNTAQNENVFGYNECWFEYRNKPNLITGAFRSNYAQSLDAWHYADYYDAPPVLNMAWMSESPVNVDRTLAVQSSVEDQFIMDMYFDGTFVRPMPIRSIPGLNISHF